MYDQTKSSSGTSIQAWRRMHPLYRAGGMSRQNVVVDKNTWIAVLKCIAPAPVRRVIFGKSNEDHHFDFFHIDWIKSLSDPFFLRWAMTFSTTRFFPPQGYSDKQQNMLRSTDFAVQDMVTMFLGLSITGD